ncbi:hypothetical protein HY570_00020 [Candidatus Micrarchaeota archaeon]|nr:hypothetical protein [Candidatus Micrarchaeota archaeon]
MSLPITAFQLQTAERHSLALLPTKKPKTPLEQNEEILQRHLPPPYAKWVSNLISNLKQRLNNENDVLLVTGRIIDILLTKKAKTETIKNLQVIHCDEGVKERTLLFNRIEEHITDLFSDPMNSPTALLRKIMQFLTSLYSLQPEQIDKILPFFIKMQVSNNYHEPSFDINKINNAINKLEHLKYEGLDEIRSRVLSILSKSRIKEAEEWILDYLEHNKKQFRNFMLRDLSQIEKFLIGNLSEDDLKKTLVPVYISLAFTRKVKCYVEAMKKLEGKYADTENYENYKEQLIQLMDKHRRLCYSNKVTLDPRTGLIKINKRFFLDIIDNVQSIAKEFNLD